MKKDNKPTFFMGRIIGITYILTFLSVGFLSFPLIVATLNVLQQKDFIFNYKEFTKIYTEIDSVDIRHSKGASDIMTFDGYSKELDAHRTTIKFGTINLAKFNSFFYEENDKRYAYIWYRKESEYAYPARKEETQFPIKECLNEHLVLLPYWVILLITNRVCSIIIKRYRLKDKNPSMSL